MEIFFCQEHPCLLYFPQLRLYERGQSLSQSVYSEACSGLGDDNEDVRRKAAKLVWVLCRLYPERWVLVVVWFEFLKKHLFASL